jgi:molecular chaperone HscB
MNDPFATLGVPRRFRLDAKLLEQRHRDLSRALHPDRFAQSSPAERKLSIEKASAVNDAFRALKNPQSRANALLASAGRPVEEHARADQALLLQVMELREQLEALRDRPDRATAMEPLRAEVAAEVAKAEGVIADAFDASDALPTGEPLERAYQAVVKLRYLYRFLEEADAFAQDD